MGEAFAIRQDSSLAQIPAQVAASWARAGFPVFPCGSDKKPLTPHGFKDATTNLDAVAAYWQANPRALVGLPTGETSGLFVVDLDTDRQTGEVVGEASLAALGLSHLIGAVPTVATPSGGRHLYFRDCGLGSTANKLGPKIDTRGNGGYIIAPGSVTPAGAYVLLNSPLTRESLQSAPDAILERLRGHSAPHQPLRGLQGLEQKTDAAEVLDLLAHIPPDCSYSDWVAVLMGLHDHFDGSTAGLSIADDWSAKGYKYKPGEVSAKWRGFQLGGGAGWGSVCELARQNGADLGAIAKLHKGNQNTTRRAMPKPSAGPASDNQKQRSGNEGKTRAKWCADIACTILETNPDWAEVLAYDEFAGLYLLLKPIPGTTVPRSTFTPRPIADTDITAAVRWFNRNGFPDATKNGAADALFLVASSTIISPVRHFLEGLAWDGFPRVQNWLSQYCGAERSDLTAKVGTAWLVSAVARVLKPGCKADCALVLEGKQGAGKSSILRALAGDEWFHDGLSDMHGKDASAALRGKWIIELPELSAMRRSDTEAVKAFLSRTEERYRPAYGRTEVIEPRRCVFAGTTNRNDYLTDDTGGRRFWPVTVGAVNLDELTADREQIWAEAVDLYRNGARWWLDKTDESAAAAVVATRAADDPWSADVLRVVDGLSEVSTRDVFQLLDIAIDRRGKADAMRITGILTRAGWAREGKFTSGPNRDLSRYVAPKGGHHV
ncbi:VapE domain-containing protein [Pseudorhodobacter wandonensis]|uniref:VapE domain-containing protein n=1 Tax=Pseudorhodobacter wandonensis TaxID=1120568 RepID=UPI00067DE33F|nr:VapE domain-containing protein [Pseudorhodobacter wandonensis]